MYDWTRNFYKFIHAITEKNTTCELDVLGREPVRAICARGASGQATRRS